MRAGCVTVLLALAQILVATHATAQSSEPVNIQADTVMYETSGRVIFRGDVELYFGLFILTADELVYDEKAQRLIASGNVRVKYPDGGTSQADRWTLPEEIRDALVRSLRSADSRLTPDPPP